MTSFKRSRITVDSFDFFFENTVDSFDFFFENDRVSVGVRVRLNPQRRKRCLWIRTPRGVPPFSVTPGLPGNQTSQRLDVPRPSFDLL